MASIEDARLRDRVGWVTAIALVAYAKRRALAAAEPEHCVCWWNRGGFTIPACVLAAGASRDYECCMTGLNNPPAAGATSWKSAISNQ